MTQVKAKIKQADLSAQKARLVLDQIRGLKVEKAWQFLNYSPQKAAGIVGKLLRSVVTNAENNHNLDISDLKIFRAYADEGRTLKRWKARARGRSSRILKRACHITLVVTDSEENIWG